MSELVERREPTATWDDLAMPPAQVDALREIASQLRGDGTAKERSGTARRPAREPGIGALLIGRSGADRTMVAEVLAVELGVDLYRVDLGRVVSKYIGETEKNIGRLFDAAEGRDAILLLDEADALFGRRTEVKDSHDRYANTEVGYLLQRMESHRGLTILATNTKESIDEAFLRRLRFVVRFPASDQGDPGS